MSKAAIVLFTLASLGWMPPMEHHWGVRLTEEQLARLQDGMSGREHPGPADDD